MLKIWDAPTRIYHWLQAILFAVLALGGFGFIGSELLHERFGLLLSTLVIWRIGWGVVGSDTSRFVNFFPTVIKLRKYFSGERKNIIGHNPVGAMMVFLMLLLLLIQALTGVLISEVVDSKVLFEKGTIKVMKTVHEINAFSLVLFSGIHVLAILIYRLKGQLLIRAMITGYTSYVEPIKPLRFASNLKAVSLLIVTIVVLILFVNLV